MTAARHFSGETVERAYRDFCRSSAPLWLWLVASEPLTLAVVGTAIFAIDPRLPLPNLPFDPVDFTFHWVVTALLAFFVYRGRRSVRTMLSAGLPLWKIGGCAVIASIAGLAWESTILHLTGLQSRATIHFPRGSTLYELVVAPTREEFVFQAVLQTVLQRFGAFAAIIGATAIFSLSHGWLEALADHKSFQTISAGMLVRFGPLLAFAVVRQKTKSLGAAILSHGLFNIALDVIAL